MNLNFDASGNPHYYVTDWQGNNIGVVDRNGKLEQRTDYYPYGEPWLEPEATLSSGGTGGIIVKPGLSTLSDEAEQDAGVSTAAASAPESDTSVNCYLFADKERTRTGGLNDYRFPARDYVPGFPRFTTVDPLSEKTPWLSPYAYCAGNPVMLTDPTGEIPTPAEAACMAAHIYGDMEDDILIGDWEKTKDNLGLKLDNRNGLKSAIYARRDKEGNDIEYAYVMAGTELEFDDIAADISQILGMSKQYDNALNSAKKIIAKYSQELTFIGHSLGGGEAALNSIVTGKKAITFNAAGLSPATLLRYHAIGKTQSNIEAYIMRTDPLNILQDASGLMAFGLNPFKGLYPANGNRNYLEPSDFVSVIKGHAIKNILKSFGINPQDYEID